ncbi:hypothetical protein DN730_08155 [Marinomonas piezotolerans]|uniref:Uncharacterized protein n=1 Tax=Marinomonas piezotolerans TaxID=2213058 RepID=A0A370U9B0_9GAMM|nr:hypothetical protein [Marinomonas piezotolerans]RDL44367.1 hypothetical protein DN730_08155 [Marinomonas piezotolerans]
MSVAIAAVGVTAYSAYQNGENADRSAGNQEKVIEAQNRIAQAQLDMAQEDRDYYEQTYRPLEEEIAANAGVTDAETNQMVAQAGLTTANAMDSANAQRERNLQRMGVNPNSGAYAANTRKNAIAKAVAKANSQNSARAAAEQQDYSEKVAAVGLGKGITSSVGGLMSSAANTYGNSAAGYGMQMQAYGNAAASSAQLGMQIGGAAMASYGENGFDKEKFGNLAIGNYNYGVQKQ